MQSRGSPVIKLLHRSASAIIKAQRFNAAHAVMLVHSFRPTRGWFQDYAALVTLFGGSATEHGIVAVGTRSSVTLQLAWMRGHSAYLDK